MSIPNGFRKESIWIGLPKSPKQSPPSSETRPLLRTASAIFVAIVIIFFSILRGTVNSLYIPIATENTSLFQFDSVAQTAILSRCAQLRTAPGPLLPFYSRTESDRFEPGTNATLIRNCTIFTGKENGTEVIQGDILLDKGIILGIGKISRRVLHGIENITTVEANGAWVTPGLVDLHTHLGVLSAPIFRGAIDLNTIKGPIAPYLRTIDGLNTHDESYQLAIAGGVTSAQILPGSNNVIGGQAFMIKLRKPKNRSASGMLLEPPYILHLPDSEDPGKPKPYRWRYLTQACGENLIGYGNRMDTLWSFRSAYAEALRIKNAQDDYCLHAELGYWSKLNEPFPDDPKWEMLVEVLRGRVKVSTHCSEAVDLDAIVRLTNEFKFPIASVHHASEAYLVPSTLKKMFAWGGTPSVAIFATNHRYKSEAYRGSEFAARVLADVGIPVVMKSDHPVLNSRYLIYEAQQAHYFGLAPGVALSAVTSSPAVAAGLSHRIGILDVGFDADVVMWDSHPLRLGATPKRVWIDGILQIPVPAKDGKEAYVEVGKGKEGDEFQQVPDTPNWDKERNRTIAWEGLPPLEGIKKEGAILFTNVKEMWQTSAGRTKNTFSTGHISNQNASALGNVLVVGGRILCHGHGCADLRKDAVTKDLQGGTICPGLMTYGSPIGLEEIASEASTRDGLTYDAFNHNVPKILNDNGAVVRAMDGLIFGTRNALTAYRAGVTLATTSLARPIYLAGADAHVISGLSVAFRTGAAHSMQKGAVIQDVTALHVVVGHSFPTERGISVSTQIATLRRLLYGWETTDQETGAWFKKAAEGILPLVIDVDNVNIMANLLILKMEVEDKIGSRMRMVFSGAMEAHLLAKEIRDADVGVILNPMRPFPMVWDQRRILPGPPLTNDTALVTLLEHGVVVGLGIRSGWEARNTRFDVKWAALESNGRISYEQAYGLVTDNLIDLLGIRSIDEDTNDLVALEGGSIFDLSSKPIAVISSSRGFVDLF